MQTVRAYCLSSRLVFHFLRRRKPSVFHSWWVHINIKTENYRDATRTPSTFVLLTKDIQTQPHHSTCHCIKWSTSVPRPLTFLVCVLIVVDSFSTVHINQVVVKYYVKILQFVLKLESFSVPWYFSAVYIQHWLSRKSDHKSLGFIGC